MKRNELNLIACASGLAGADINSAQGPLVIRNSPYLAELIKNGFPIEWHSTIEQPHLTNSMHVEDGVRIVCDELAMQVSNTLRRKQSVCVIAGDHTSAIGTFSGVHAAIHQKGDLGLIWLDAHMDSHTPETSESGRIHGMPLACLLGYGYPVLTSITSHLPKLKPENVCVVGVRSYERGEAELLKRLNVRVYFMDEVKERGLAVVMQEARARVAENTVGYGLSLDMDVIDPKEAPGVDVPEADGVKSKELAEVLTILSNDAKLLATEIVEFDPKHDKQHITEKLVVDYIGILAKGLINSP